ncbi:nitrate reductase-like narX domain protein [Mycobacterium xenopi 3993]|nr:nitrate reductase-like narX domain protein [Mycobacterium xenopi 3993]
MLERCGRFFTPGEISKDLRTVTRRGGRDADVFYRDRWSHDKVVRSTHGVNCTGSCSWKIYVKDGIITWETQQTDYPSVGPDRPEYEPRGCPAAHRFPGTAIHRPGSATRTRARCSCRCSGKPRPASATRCWHGPTSRPTRSAAAATSKLAARVAWSG